MKRLIRYLYRKIKSKQGRLLLGCIYGTLALGGFEGAFDIASVAMMILKGAYTDARSKIKNGTAKIPVSSLSERGRGKHGSNDGNGRVPDLRSGDSKVRQAGTSDGLRVNLPRKASGPGPGEKETQRNATAVEKCPDCGEETPLKDEIVDFEKGEPGYHLYLECSKCGYDSRRQHVSMQSNTS